jgi:hypothetical protein
MKDSGKKTIYELKLHEILDVNFFSVLRVAGGWLYFDKGNMLVTFVPFNNEFQEVI